MNVALTPKSVMRTRSIVSATLLGCMITIAGCGGDSSDPSSETNPSPGTSSSPPNPGGNANGNSQQNQNNDRSNQNRPQPDSNQAAMLASADLGALAILDGNTSGDPVTDQSGQEFSNVAKILTAAPGVLAVTTNTVYCGPDPAADTGNGSIVTENNDQDPAGRSTGDSVTVTFNQCVRGGAPNARTINGTRTYVLNNVTGEPYVTAPWTVDTTANLDLTITTSVGAFVHKNTSSVVANSTDGVVITRKSTGDVAHTSTPTGATAETSARKFDITFTKDSNAQSYSLNANISSDNPTEKRTVVTDTPISGLAGSPPNAGIVTITSIDNASQLTSITKLTAQADGTVLVEVDDNGDGTIDSTTTQAWFDLVGLGLHFGGSSGGGGGGGLSRGGAGGIGGGGGGVSRPGVQGVVGNGVSRSDAPALSNTGSNTGGGNGAAPPS